MTSTCEDVPQSNITVSAPSRLSSPGRRSLAAVMGFFVLKAAIGFLILVVSARHLPVSEFATFSQLFLYLALLGSMAAAGVQNGVIREVAAAHGDLRQQRVFVLAGLVVWACFSIAITVLAITFRGTLAIILIGNRSVAGAVVDLTIAALFAGLGTLLCSALSGSGRAPFSLVVQGIGLTIGGALCLLRLQANDPVGAALGYAIGPVCAVFVALWGSRHWLNTGGLSWRELRRAARGLLGYSGTFLVVASALPIVLFGVRYVYRLEFGTGWLGYWLMANRASDVTTQVVGLYLSQVFLPHVTQTTQGPERLREIRRALVLGVVTAGSGAAVFAIGGRQIVALALSSNYLDALPFILGYLVGDTLRVAGNVALYTVLATRRLVLFVSIEVGLALLVGIAILIGIALGQPSAAYWGYLCAHATAFAVIVLFLTRRLSVL